MGLGRGRGTRAARTVRHSVAAGCWSSFGQWFGREDSGTAPGWGDRCWMCGTGAVVRYLEAKLAKLEDGGVRREEEVAVGSVWWGTCPCSVLSLVTVSVCVPVRGTVHLGPSLSIHVWSLAASCLSALRPGAQMLACLRHLSSGELAGSSLARLGAGRFGPGPSKGLPHPDTLCCAPQASSVPLPAPRAMEPSRNWSLL